MKGLMFLRRKWISAGISGLFHGLLFWGLCSISVAYERGPEIEQIVEVNLISLGQTVEKSGRSELTLSETNKDEPIEVARVDETKNERVRENPKRVNKKEIVKSKTTTKSRESNNKGGKADIVEAVGKSKVEGAGVSGGDRREPKLLVEYINRKPNYPDLARKRGQQGVVELMIVVSSEGVVTRVEIQKSSGHKLLDREAVKTVKTWKFSPAMKGNQKVEGHVIVPIEFRLH